MLYADKVTIYSPAASMLEQVREFAALSDPRQQVLAMLDLADSVPVLRAQLSVDASVLEQLRQFMQLDPRVVRAAARAAGQAAELAPIYDMLDELATQWQTEMPGALESVTATVGGKELLAAVDSGAVTVADLAEPRAIATVASALRAATGESDNSTDELTAAFVARVLETLGDPHSFPLLDAQASGLVRALERESDVRLSQAAVRRSGEVSAATQFMGFLPYFPELSMHETLDLRSALTTPLVRFRAAMARLSRSMSARAIDLEFEAEVEDLWRVEVEPALLELRDAFAQRGLLREIASVALGDPRRLLAETGGVFAAAGTHTISLSALMTAGLAAGLPIADVVGRALANRLPSQRSARAHSLYFLHLLGDEAQRHR